MPPVQRSQPMRRWPAGKGMLHSWTTCEINGIQGCIHWSSSYDLNLGCIFTNLTAVTLPFLDKYAKNWSKTEFRSIKHGSSQRTHSSAFLHELLRPKVCESTLASNMPSRKRRVKACLVGRAHSEKVLLCGRTHSENMLFGKEHSYAVPETWQISCRNTFKCVLCKDSSLWNGLQIH